MHIDAIQADDDVSSDSMLPVHAWEYRLVSSGTIMKGSMVAALNRLGAAGWEVIGLAGSDKTLGLNSLEVLLKRPLIVDGHLVPATRESPRQRGSELGGAEPEIDVPDNLPDSEFSCVECGTLVPEAAEACPTCGWTWT